MADVSITAANVATSSDSTLYTLSGTAGATITQGQPLAGETTALEPADATDSALHKVVGIALNAASSGQPVDYVIRDPEFNPGFTVTVGTVYVLGDAAGGIAPAADLSSGEYAVVIGPGLTAAKLPVDFSASRWGGAVP